MKNLLILVLILSPLTLFSQVSNYKVFEKVKEKKAQNLEFKKEVLFNVNAKKTEDNYKNAVSEGILLDINLEKVTSFLTKNTSTFSIDIPVKSVSNIVTLELYKVSVLADGYRVVTSNDEDITATADVGVHYRGIVKGESKSLVSLSIFKNQINGFISMDKSNYMIGKMEGATTKHIIYKDSNLLKTDEFTCGVEDDGVIYSSEELVPNNPTRDPGDCVNIYIEAGQTVVNAFGGNQADALAFLNGVFAQSYTIYANEGLTVQTSDIFLWTTSDPYNGPNTGSYLGQFQSNTPQNGFNGDLGHLVEVDNVGGQAAGFSGICNTDTDESLCFSGFSGTNFNTVPTYSFNVYLITHEMGHLFGSRHTHACVWNGNGTAIDGCAGFTEGFCTIPPSANPGTIMSYCTPNIDFVEGFHPQPSTVINASVNTIGNCLSTCAVVEDITLANQSVTPTIVDAGDTVSVSIDQEYTGTSTSVPNVILHYYLSTDCIVDGSDILLDTDSSTIDATDTVDTETATLTIPAGTIPGNYFILFFADATDVVTESDETNNTSCRNILVNTPLGDDIFLSNESLTPNSLKAGETFVAEIDQNYSGASNSVPDVVLNYYLSTDCIIDSGDILLGTDSSTIDASDTSDTESETLTIPTGTTPGTYFIIFQGDATDVVAESDETNNETCVQITVEQPEDIFLTNDSLTPDSLEAGETFVAEIDQNYSGGSTSVPNVVLNYYFSSDCIIDSGDILLGTDSSTIDASDTSDTESETLTIPTGTTPGTYFIIFQGDATDVVAESDENNNETCVQITVTQPEDVFLTNQNVTPSTLAQGDTMSLVVEQNYSGSSSPNPAIVLHYYLSSDCIVDSGDLLLATDFSNIDAGNPIENEDEIVIIPTTITPGNYFIIFQADATDVISEADETNNIACEQIIIEPILGLEENSDIQNFVWYPNPTTGILNFNGNINTLKSISIFDISGKTLLIKSNNFTERKIDLSSYASGIYFIKVTDVRNTAATFKVIKK